ncbi:hypothetical protein GCM10010403_18310 [Glycomyces rutgersensis]|uniref:Uncharacterized protein n=1 Tax=Glycomyces rutgersensis TaxID=58115 RepID=A0ABN3FDV9_9ACTN
MRDMGASIAESPPNRKNRRIILFYRVKKTGPSGSGRSVQLHCPAGRPLAASGTTANRPPDPHIALADRPGGGPPGRSNP